MEGHEAPMGDADSVDSSGEKEEPTTQHGPGELLPGPCTVYIIRHGIRRDSDAEEAWGYIATNPHDPPLSKVSLFYLFSHIHNNIL